MNLSTKKTGRRLSVTSVALASAALLILGSPLSASAATTYTLTSFASGPGTGTQVIGVDYALNRIWVAKGSSSTGTTLIEIGGKNHGVVGSAIPLRAVAAGQTKAYPIDIAVDTVAHRIYVLTDDNVVSVVDAATHALVYSVPVDLHAFDPNYTDNRNEMTDIAVDSVSHRAYVSNPHLTYIAAIDGTTGTATKFQFTVEMSRVAVDTSTHVLWAQAGKSIYAITTAGAITRTIPTKYAAPAGITVNSAKHSVYALVNGGNMLAAISSGSTQVTRYQSFQSLFDDISVDSSTASVYVTGQQSIAKLDGATVSSSKKFTGTASGVGSIAVDRSRHIAYAIHSASMFWALAAK